MTLWGQDLRGVRVEYDGADLSLVAVPLGDERMLEADGKGFVMSNGSSSIAPDAADLADDAFDEVRDSVASAVRAAWRDARRRYGWLRGRWATHDSIWYVDLDSGQRCRLGQGEFP